MIGEKKKTKVITYGTYDLLHYGHIRLLKRAKALGDYLIVGVTADDFDKKRGKINVQQSLMERIEAVRNTGLADEIIVEEYEGQKIDDIRRYDVDIFTVGSDWEGKFDYLNDYCKVIYLERTEGVSSSQIRADQRKIRLGIVGSSPISEKLVRESQFVNGIEIVGICTEDTKAVEGKLFMTSEYSELLCRVDAVYVISPPKEHYRHIKRALENGKHVLCESPVTLGQERCAELFAEAERNGCVLMDAVKTAYATAYSRLLLLVKEGRVGEIYSVDATCTSLRSAEEEPWGSICGWGPTAMLPIFHILGTEYQSKSMVTHLDKDGSDLFTKVDFVFKHAVASLKVGKGVKSEGELIISGSKGYIYVPAPWWKTDYFEIRFEDSTKNRRFFYQLDGEGIRYELVAFMTAIQGKKSVAYIERSVSEAVSKIIGDFYNGKDLVQI